MHHRPQLQTLGAHSPQLGQHFSPAEQGQLRTPPHPSAWLTAQTTSEQVSGVHTHTPGPDVSLQVSCALHGLPQFTVPPQPSSQFPQRWALHGSWSVQQLELFTHTWPGSQPVLSQPLPSPRHCCSKPLWHRVAPGAHTVQSPCPEHTGVPPEHDPPLSN